MSGSVVREALWRVTEWGVASRTEAVRSMRPGRRDRD